MTNWKLIIAVLNTQEKRSFFAILALMIFFSLFESFGLALIVPYVEVLSNPERVIAVAQVWTGLEWTAKELVIWLTVLFCLSITIKSVLQMYLNYQIAKFPYQFYRRKALFIFNRYLHQNYQDFIKGNTGLFLKNCTTTIDQCANALVQYLRYLAAIVMTIFLTILILTEFFALSMGVIALFGLIGAWMHHLVKKPMNAAGEEKETIFPKVFQTISDGLLSFKEVKLYEKQNYFSSLFDSYVKRIARSQTVTVYYPTVPMVLIEYVALIGLLGVVVVWILSNWPASELVAPMLFLGAVGRRLLPAVNQVVSQRIQMQAFQASLQCLDLELHKNIETTHQEFSPHARSFLSSLAFENVCYSYSNDVEVLHDVSFQIMKNSSVAFVGPSGVGKSTLVDILISLLSPDSGKFQIDGKSVHSLQGIKHLIGYVPQDIALVDGSIAQNVAFGESTIDTQKLHDALVMAHLHEFVQTLPEKANTHVGERGVRLSGGQKQRVGIARALYHQPEILVFDEATSSLDHISESIIAQAIKEMAGRKTIVAIAHRLSTVENFDCIHVLEAGRIVMKGTHQELLETSNLYQRLCTDPVAVEASG